MKHVKLMVDVASMFGQLTKTVRSVKTAKLETERMKLESERRISESNDKLQRSIARNNAEIIAIENRYAEMRRVQQEETDKTMAALDKLAREFDATYTRAMAEVNRG